MEIIYLKMQASCLKALNRKDEYIRIVLDILAKKNAEGRSKSSTQIDHERFLGSKHPYTSALREAAGLDDKNMINDLATYSEQLRYDITCSLELFIDELDVDDCIAHDLGQDGFQLRLLMRQQLADEIQPTSLRVRLASLDENNQDREIWLVNDAIPALKNELTTLCVKSHVSGEYDTKRQSSC